MLYKDNTEFINSIITFYNKWFDEIHIMDLNEEQTRFVKKEEEIINASISNFNTLNGILENYLLKENV